MDWLSVALHDNEAQIRTANTNRAGIAVKHRVERRFARYMTNARSEAERKARLSAIDDELRLLANEVAIEYSAPDPDSLYQAAIKLAYDFGAPYQQVQEGTPEHGYSTVPCANCGTPAALGAPCPSCGHVNQPGQDQAAGGMGGLRNRLQPMAAEVPADGYDRRSVDPDEAIGTTPASSSGESFKGAEKSLDAAKGTPSKLHPADEQDIEDKGNWRDDQAYNQSDPNAPKIKMKNENTDGGAPHGKELVGPHGGGSNTFGDSHGVTDAVTETAVSKLGNWFILDS